MEFDPCYLTIENNNKEFVVFKQNMNYLANVDKFNIDLLSFVRFVVIKTSSLNYNFIYIYILYDLTYKIYPTCNAKCK